jgi:predicted DNA-binding transcriptional regulator AlpA
VERTDHHLLAAQEVAQAIGQSQRTLRRMIEQGDFPAGFPAPRQLRWMWGDVRRWIERQKLLSELRPELDNAGQSGTNEKLGENQASRPAKAK